MEQNIVRIARAMLGIGQDEMAGLMGVSKNTIYNWEKGKTEPSRAAIDRFHKMMMERQDADLIKRGGGPDLCLVVAPDGFFRAAYGREAPFAPFRETYQTMSAAFNRAHWLFHAGRLGHAFIVGASERILVDYQELRTAIEADGQTSFWISTADESPMPFEGRMVWRHTCPDWEMALESAASLIAQGLTIKMSTPDAVFTHADIVATLASR